MNARMEETVRTAKKNQPERMVKPSLKSLKGKKKGQEVDIVTPPNNEIPSLDELDSDASYLSICCLLQTESEASSRLVTESQILSKMLDKLSSGTPRDIEQLTLGAIANALTWIPSEIVEVLIRDGDSAGHPSRSGTAGGPCRRVAAGSNLNICILGHCLSSIVSVCVC